MRKKLTAKEKAAKQLRDQHNALCHGIWLLAQEYAVKIERELKIEVELTIYNGKAKGRAESSVQTKRVDKREHINAEVRKAILADPTFAFRLLDI